VACLINHETRRTRHETRMLQYKIPQDVGIADKIVGPFSLRQMIIVAIGVGISYVLFAITSKLYELNILEYIIIALPAFIAIAAAMVKINNIPLPKFTLLALEFAIKPKRRIWDHRGIAAIVAPDLSEKKPRTEKSATEEKTTRNNVNLKDLSRILDSGGFEHVEKIKHEGIDQATDDDLMTEAYFGHKKEKNETKNMYWRTKDSHKKRLDILAKMPATKVKKKEIPLTESAGPRGAGPQPSPTEAKPSGGEAKGLRGAEVQPAPSPAHPLGREAVPQSEATAQSKSSPLGREERVSPQLEKRKKRRRKKKPRFAKPVRQETQINTTQKKKPVKLIPREPQKPTPRDEKPTAGGEQIESTTGGVIGSKAQAQKEQAEPAKSGEIHLEELQKGEIELNLD